MTVFITLIFVSCPNQMNSTIVESDVSESTGESIVYDDPSRGVSVYVDASGVETLIQSEEESGLILCVEVIDSSFPGNNGSANRSAGSSAELWQAIVLGRRSDGSFGLWMVYSGGRVTSIIIDGDLEGSDLQNLIAARRPWSKYFGWTYENLKIAVNGNEFIIVGSAKNDNEIGWHNYSLAVDTPIGVYWAGKIIKEYEENIYFSISRAKVIGLKDQSWRKDFKQPFDKSENRYRHRWMWALRMFFSGWYDKYLTVPDSVVLEDEVLGEYRVDGIDQEEEKAFAILTANKVLSIEKVPDIIENRPPYPVIGPFPSVEYTEGSGYKTFLLVIDEKLDMADPDGDEVYFRFSPASTWVTLDESSGLVTVDTINLHAAETFSFWSEDEFGDDTSGEPFEVTISVIEDNTLPTTKIVFASDRDGDLEIYSMALDTSIVTQLTTNTSSDKQPSLSSDGTKIAFVSDRSGDWGIYTMDADGRDDPVLLVTLDSSFDGNPEWNPDGTMIVYDNKLDIYIMDSNGSNISGMLVTLVGSFNGHPSWNPDGLIIAYDNDFDIYTINTNNFVEDQITDTSFDSEIYASWSPDGTKIAFSKRLGSGLYDIYTMNSNGSSLKNLTNTSGEDETVPDWSTDGTRLAYVRNGDIYTIDIEGTGPETNLTKGGSLNQDPSW